MRYFLEMVEEMHRMPRGDVRGYATLVEASAAALRFVDDACPRNRIRIMPVVREAYLAGDGESALTTMDSEVSVQLVANELAVVLAAIKQLEDMLTPLPKEKML